MRGADKLLKMVGIGIKKEIARDTEGLYTLPYLIDF